MAYGGSCYMGCVRFKSSRYDKVRCMAHVANIVRNRVCVQSVCHASHRKRTQT